MALREIDQDENWFSIQFPHFTQMGADPALVVELYPMLISDDKKTRETATEFIEQHVGTGDPSNREHVAEHAGYVREARIMVAERHLPPVPSRIRAEYLPSEEALNKRLDEASGRTAKDVRFQTLPGSGPRERQAGAKSTADGIRGTADLSNEPRYDAEGNRIRRGEVFSLSNDGKYHASRTIDL